MTMRAIEAQVSLQHSLHASITYDDSDDDDVDDEDDDDDDDDDGDDDDV